MQADNLSDELKARGLSTVNTLDKLWDGTFTYGGPIKRDKLWFFTAHRTWGRRNLVPGNYFNTDPRAWTYTPDLSRPAIEDNHYRHNGLRLTWQASPRNKVNASLELQQSVVGYSGGIAKDSPEAAFKFNLGPPNNVAQVTWKFPATSRLLLEAGVLAYIFNDPWRISVPEAEGLISVQELATGRIYRSSRAGYGGHPTNQVNQRFAVSYVTGSHEVRFGVQTGEVRNTKSRIEFGDAWYNFCLLRRICG